MLVKKDCSNPALLYDTPVCDCGAPSADSCFYGAKCEVKLTCLESVLGYTVQSCTPFTQSGRGSVEPTSVCGASAIAPALCTAGADADANVIKKESDATGNQNDEAVSAAEAARKEADEAASAAEAARKEADAMRKGTRFSKSNIAPFFQNGLQAKSGFEMCFGPSTLGAGAKTRLESRIKKFTPHCICRYPRSGSCGCQC